ncbi:MAG: hypothetical protein WD206_00930 [Actinomycetota bacterium]
MLALLRKNLTTVVVALVTAAVTAGGVAVAGQVINADKLEGRKANELIRGSANHTGGLAKVTALRGGDGAQLIQTKVTAPRRGYLMVTAGADVFAGIFARRGDIPNTTQCWITIDGAFIDGSGRWMEHATGNNEEDCSTNVGWVVPSGQHTVRLMIDANKGLSASSRSIEVIFVPFNGTGKVPDLEAIPKPRIEHAPNA